MLDQGGRRGCPPRPPPLLTGCAIIGERAGTGEPHPSGSSRKGEALEPPQIFTEMPRVEWRGLRPFAFARLSRDYARQLESLAHRLAPELDRLEPKAKMLPWAGPYGARFSRYNIFLLDPAYLPLFLALRHTYRTFLEATKAPRSARFLRAWLNIHQAGEQIGRHLHDATFIGTFAARAEGSETRYGGSSERDEDDVVIPNVDGQLVLTVGKRHYHETSCWERSDVARVTYAFDILGEEGWRANRVQMPFDGDPRSLSGPSGETPDS